MNKAKDVTIDNKAFKDLPDGTKLVIRAKNQKQYNKMVKKIQKAGGTNLVLKFKKLK